MTNPLKRLGWNRQFARQLEALDRRLQPARVTVEHRRGYELAGESGGYRAELLGRVRHEARGNKMLLPGVGDWVAVDHKGRTPRIVHLLERRTRLVRQAAGESTVAQLIAANVDSVFVVTSLNREFNSRRLERYISAVLDGGAKPIVLLTKLDLCPDSAPLIAEAEQVAGGVPVYAMSSVTGNGLDKLETHLEFGKTIAFVGSSGVGKTTLINHLLGEERFVVLEIRESDDRGRHATTRRELVVLPDDRGIVIDTPGMRELARWMLDAHDDEAGFEDIHELAAQCKFRDCLHAREPDCAVKAAVDSGTLAAERLAAFGKLAGEAIAQKQRQDAHAQNEQGRELARTIDDAEKASLREKAAPRGDDE